MRKHDEVPIQRRPFAWAFVVMAIVWAIALLLRWING